MRCQKLNTDFCNVLKIIYSGKRGYDGKKCVSYYPFGLKHKGYNNVTSGNVNSVASKFKYNGVELEESLGLNLYEMELRLYDPAIARWNAIDPVTHFSYSTYSAFDNNPVFWADPSGANSINGEMVGADGLTNSQWVELSRPGNGGSEAMRAQAKQNRSILSKDNQAKVEVGELSEYDSNDDDTIVETYIKFLKKWSLVFALRKLAKGNESETDKLYRLDVMEKMTLTYIPKKVRRTRLSAFRRTTRESTKHNKNYGSIIFGENYSVEGTAPFNPNGDFGYIYRSGSNIFMFTESGMQNGQGFMDGTFASYPAVLFEDNNGKHVGGLYFRTRKLYDSFLIYFQNTLVDKLVNDLSKKIKD